MQKHSTALRSFTASLLATVDVSNGFGLIHTEVIRIVKMTHRCFSLSALRYDKHGRISSMAVYVSSISYWPVVLTPIHSQVHATEEAQEVAIRKVTMETYPINISRQVTKVTAYANHLVVAITTKTRKSMERCMSLRDGLTSMQIREMQVRLRADTVETIMTLTISFDTIWFGLVEDIIFLSPTICKLTSNGHIT